MKTRKLQLMLGAAALVVMGAAGARQAAAQTATCTATFDANGHETLALTATGLSAAGYILCVGNETIFTASYYTALTFNPETVTTSQVNLYSTEITGKLNGGTLLYDQTFPAAFNSPSVQGGVASAIAAITTAGGPGVVIMSPKLVSHNVTTTSSSSSTYTVSAVNTTQDVQTLIGPQTVNTLPVVENSTSVSYNPDGSLFTTTYVIANPELEPAMPGQYMVCTPTLSTLNDLTFENSTATTVGVGTVLATKPVCTPYNGGTYTVAGGVTDINLATTTTFTIDTATLTTLTTTMAEVYDVDGLSVHGVGTIHAVAPVAVFDQSDGFATRSFDQLQGGLWLTPWGSRSTTASVGSAPGDRRDASGLDGGLAWKLGPVRLGVAAETGGTDLTSSDGSEWGRLNMGSLGAFAQTGGDTGWGASFGAGAARGHVATTVTVPGFNEAAQARETVSERWLAAEVHDTIRQDRWTVTPNAGLTRARTSLKGFSETGSTFDVAGSADGLNRDRQWAGLDIAYAASQKLNLSAGIKAVHFTGAVTPGRPVAFVDFPDATGLVVTAPHARANGTSFNLGADYQVSKAASLFIAADALTRDGKTDTAVWAGIRAAF